MPRWTWVLLLLPWALSGCGCNKQPPRSTIVRNPAPIDPWVLTCTDPTTETPALLWNGQIGVRLDRMATGIDESRPMFCIDEYETGDEEKIRPLLNPVGLDVSRNLDLDPSQPYLQQLDMRTGILTTRWQSAAGVSVGVQTMLHPTQRAITELWTIRAAPGTQFSLAAVCGDHGAIPDSRDPKAGTWLLGPSSMPVTVRQECDADNATWQFMRAGTRFEGTCGRSGVVRYRRLLVFGADTNAESMEKARQAAARPASEEFPDVPEAHWAATVDAPLPALGKVCDELLRQSKSYWSKEWRTDIEIDGPVEDQQAVRSFLFYLRSAIAPSSRMSISPFGLSNDRYGGHVFWDADIWVFPALALLEPADAKALAKYRLDLAPRAAIDFGEWLRGDRAKAAGVELTLAPSHPAPLKYPWESSVTGKETVPGPSRLEEHITGDVAFMLDQAGALGLVPSADVERLRPRFRDFWLYRSDSPPPSIQIKNVMSPDESHIGDNDLYTNLLAQWCVNGGSWTTGGKAPTFRLPRDQVSFLTYDDDPLKGYKQAAAVLSIYPLQYPPAEKEAGVMMERFADKITPNGPAMSDSLHALIWARLNNTQTAYTTWEKSWRDFVKPPFLLFSEKRNKPITYFTTGAAGCLQTVLYGFLGFRIDSRQQDGAAWSTPLALGKILSVKPNLPKAWKSVKLKNFTVMGRRYTLVATHEGVHVTQGDQ